MSPLLALTLTAALSGPAAPPAPAGAPLLTQAVRIAGEGPSFTAGSTPPAWAAARGDSLKNGAVAGAVAGALATSAIIGYLCYTFNDGDNRGSDCTKVTLLWAGLGAAGGAAIGAGIDALFARAPVARVRVRF